MVHTNLTNSSHPYSNNPPVFRESSEMVFWNRLYSADLGNWGCKCKEQNLPTCSSAGRSARLWTIFNDLTILFNFFLLVFHQLDSTVEVRQCLEETRNLLKTMLRLSTVKEDWLVALQIIGDFNYAWIIIGSYTDLMQSGIKEDPLLVGKLRTIFIKVINQIVKWYQKEINKIISSCPLQWKHR